MSRRTRAHSSSDRPAQVRRAEMKADVAAELGRVLCAHDVEQSDVAEATGASTSVVQRWADRHRLETISLADIVLVGERHPAVARALLQWAASRVGCEVQSAAAIDATHDATTNAMQCVHECLDVIRSMTAAQADGEIDRAEATEELRQWDELDGVRRERVAFLRKVEREGAVSLRTVK